MLPVGSLRLVSEIYYQLCYFLPTDGSDYSQVDTTLTFTPSEDRKCFNITILNDQLREGTESFSVEILSVTSGMGVVIGNVGRANISIMDNDGEGCGYILHIHVTCSKYLHITILCCNYELVTKPKILGQG